MKRVQAVRGAVAIGRNRAEEIIEGTEKLMQEMLSINGLTEGDIISVQFTVTGDLSAANPATAFRRLGYASTPLFCILEPPFEASMAHVVRVLLTAETEEGRELRPVYLQGAEKLRPDLQDRRGSDGDRTEGKG